MKLFIRKNKNEMIILEYNLIDLPTFHGIRAESILIEAHEIALCFAELGIEKTRRYIFMLNTRYGVNVNKGPI